MAKADVLHINHGAVVGLNRVPRIELGKTVGVNQLPVRPAGQDGAAQLRSFDGAAENRHDPPPPGADFADLFRRAHDRAKFEGKRQDWFDHSRSTLNSITL